MLVALCSGMPYHLEMLVALCSGMPYHLEMFVALCSGMPYHYLQENSILFRMRHGTEPSS